MVCCHRLVYICNTILTHFSCSVLGNKWSINVMNPTVGLLWSQASPEWGPRAVPSLPSHFCLCFLQPRARRHHWNISQHVNSFLRDKPGDVLQSWSVSGLLCCTGPLDIYWNPLSTWPFSCFCSFCCYCSVIQSCPTLCDPMDCSPPGSSVRGITQARILEWVAIPFSGDLPDPGSNLHLPHWRQIVYCWATREVFLLLGTSQTSLFWSFPSHPSPSPSSAGDPRMLLSPIFLSTGSQAILWF